VALIAPVPERHGNFLTKITGAEKHHSPGADFRFFVDGGRIELNPADPVQSENSTSPTFASVAIRVKNIAELRRLLEENSLPFTSSGSGISITPTFLSGLELRFE
jgi:hypothetical protein